MSYRVFQERLFRRPRRWPWIVGLLLFSAGLVLALGLTLLDDDDDGAARRAGDASPTPEPTPQPSPAEPSGVSSASPDPGDSSPSGAAESSSTPVSTVAPTTPTSSASRPPAASRTPSTGATVAPTTTATAGPTPSSYPPPGLRLEVSAKPVGGSRALIRIRIRDTDGSFNGGRVDFGDGTARDYPQSSPTCATPRSGPYQPAPSDRTIEITHSYPASGTYDVFVRVRTDRPCEATPVEQASDVVSVTVGDPTPGPTPTPILTAPAAP